MTVRLLVAAFTVGLGSLVARAADDDNPYKTVKVGDYATYKTKITLDKLTFDGTSTQTVTEKTDAKAVVKVSATVSGTEAPATTQEIDLTKPYDPTKVGPLPGGKDGGAPTVKKEKESQEKIKVTGKDYDCTLTTYKVTGTVNNLPIDATIKTWTAKQVPMGLVKLEMNGTVGKDKDAHKLDMSMELLESGNRPTK